MASRRRDRSTTAPWEGTGRQDWEGLRPAVTGQQPAVGAVPAGREARPAPDASSAPASDAAGASDAPGARAAAAAPDAPSASSAPGAGRPRLLRLRQAVIALCVPVVSLMLGIRLVASSAFLWLEYHRPGFPADAYGFTTEDRMTYGSHGLSYVTSLAPPRFLADVVMGGRAAFSVQDITHMTDVQHVLLWATAGVAVLAVLGLLSARGLRRGAPGAAGRALFLGAWVSVLLIVVLGVLGAMGWETFFIRFHELFFPEGGWAFPASDTLIRLYPDQFWIDAAATVAALVLVVAMTLLAATWPRRRERARRAGHGAPAQPQP